MSNNYMFDYIDIHFIKELILGDECEVPKGFTWKGRGEKTFLYDIVANKRNGIDVDKVRDMFVYVEYVVWLYIVGVGWLGIIPYIYMYIYTIDILLIYTLELISNTIFFISIV